MRFPGRLFSLFSLLVSLAIFAGVPGALRFAHADTTRAVIDAPEGGPRSVVRIRWPESALAPKATGKLISITDGQGSPLPFSLAVSPEDQGHVVKPMWLVVRVNGHPPYRLEVGSGLSGNYVKDIDEMAGQRVGALTYLPLAVIPPEDWGPISATIQDAQTAQESTNANWLYWIIALAVLVAIVMTTIITFFVRGQIRREDIRKL